MANYYKQINDFKNFVKEKGFVKDIFYDDFKGLVKIYFGFSNKTAIKWINEFEDTKLISITRDRDNEIDHCVIRWVVNFIEE